RSRVGRAEPHRSGAGHSVYVGPRGFAGSRQPAAELWIEDGNRCYAEVARRRLHPAVAEPDPDERRGEAQGGRARTFAPASATSQNSLNSLPQTQTATGSRSESRTAGTER